MERDDPTFRSGTEPVVHLRGAVALLGRFPALAGVDLDVDRRRIVLLRGANGAGKTTLLRALAGLVPVTSGEAVVLGVDLREDRRAVRHRVGLLAHGTGLYDELTVADNVHFWTRAARADMVDCAMSQSAVCRLVRGGEPLLPVCWHGVPNFGCLMNRMLVSTKKDATSSMASFETRPRLGQRSS